MKKYNPKKDKYRVGDRICGDIRFCPSYSIIQKIEEDGTLIIDDGRDTYRIPFSRRDVGTKENVDAIRRELASQVYRLKKENKRLKELKLWLKDD